MKMDIRVEKTQTPKAKPAKGEELGFGTHFTDHMFIMDYDADQGWHDARIVPFGPIMMLSLIHIYNSLIHNLPYTGTFLLQIQKFRRSTDSPCSSQTRGSSSYSFSGTFNTAFRPLRK